MAARLRRLLHLGSVALVLGAVAGLYVRGLGLRYGAVWESTFLDASQAQAVADALLGPAAAVLRWQVPALAPLAEAPGDAAPWIHLWAVTALLWIALPRTLLAVLETSRLARLAAAVPLDLAAPYFRRLLAPGAGGRRSVDVLPYGVNPAVRARDALAALLHDVFGTRADVRWHEPLEYGAEADELPCADPAAEDGRQRAVVLLYALAQPPESEVHGRLAGELAGRLGDAPLLVLVDGSGYRARLGADSPRLDERRRAWDRVLKEVGAGAVHLDLERPVPDPVLAALASRVPALAGGA